MSERKSIFDDIKFIGGENVLNENYTLIKGNGDNELKINIAYGNGGKHGARIKIQNPRKLTYIMDTDDNYKASLRLIQEGYGKLLDGHMKTILFGFAWYARYEIRNAWYGRIPESKLQDKVNSYILLTDKEKEEYANNVENYKSKRS